MLYEITVCYRTKAGETETKQFMFDSTTEYREALLFIQDCRKIVIISSGNYEPFTKRTAIDFIKYLERERCA